jgi:CelD/BcsL family acetyltransferase involved in cellulose biosynthesis
MEFTLHTTFPQNLKSEWDTLLEQTATHVPFLRYEYLENWWRTRGGGEWPQAELTLVTAHHHGQLVGVAPLFFTPDWQGHPVLMLLGSIEISDYLDLMVRTPDLPEFLTGLLPFLSSGKLPAWKALDLYNLLEESPTLSALREAAAKMGWEYNDQRIYHSPYIPLPGDWETYLAGIDKKQRHEIRRKMRRLQESGLPVRWYFANDPSELDAEVDAFLAMMEQDDDKAKFLTTPMREHMHHTARVAMEGGFLGLAFLEVDGRKVGAYLCFDYLNRIWVYNSGIDRNSNEYSPGWVLLGYLLQWSNEQKREAFDFMRGDEEYKYRFGAVDRFLLRATLTR